MGNFKSKLKCFVTASILLSGPVYGLSFEEYQKQQEMSFTKYQTSIMEEFNAYKKAYDDAFNEFKKELLVKWPDKIPDVTTKVKWVEYDKDLNSKKFIDYEKEQIGFEVIANSEDEAKQKMLQMFEQTMEKDVEQAARDDILEQKIVQKINKPKPPVQSNQKLIADIIKAQEKIQLKRNLENQKLTVVKHNGKFIYKANVQLPSDSVVRKAKGFENEVKKNASKQQIPAELVYAIMHSESSFNPMARSHVPAFGLMQIVPKTAGVDSYQYLYNTKKLLSSNYLYNSSNNIEIGSGYLHILYFRYLRKITNPQSRLYCAIAAYNTGAGNVAKAFIGNTNIHKAAVKINSMTPDQVYTHLMKNLPYNETKHYLKKVTDRVSAYNKLIQNRNL
ncbi:MAG: transglycosylase SLT domain-containing protein [Campylobacterales bacterium]|nr:transglycosylase SLT domain-containing protein [Campylobacterales bacterium]